MRRSGRERTRCGAGTEGTAPPLGRVEGCPSETQVRAVRKSVRISVDDAHRDRFAAAVVGPPGPFVVRAGDDDVGGTEAGKKVLVRVAGIRVRAWMAVHG